ncbi:PREDICTED: N(G),N(G)-dimethylarginine dimethylaminohydrolase 1-like [Branchiostoma belcheri]|uniref:N(G),N(G)-dimethylarginine dimethylaminohydrolase 1-like n=1 Tax=Branchiostoma belcheri TaxID=7741 RepID=A0A6P4Z2I8_BRABE|nr:PREDICTED: N(G),N(G)-dimethylarginine dimethylaminohydrolase 1-like [Branchiostoma belcheri]
MAMDQSQKISATDGFPKFTRALVRGIPDSIREKSEAIKSDEEGRFDEEEYLVEPVKAREEQEKYIQTLRDLGLEVTVIPADESTPDCAFVGDTCVVVGNKALVTRPWGIPRRKELDAVEECLRNLGLEVDRIHNETACLEGGDVVFTGKEFFVGASVNSNKAGRKALAKTFPEYPITVIPVEWPDYYLKGVMCCAGPGLLTVAKNMGGKIAWKTILKHSNFKYEPIWIPDPEGVACIHVNGTVIHCVEDDAPDSIEVFEAKLTDYERVQFPLGELGKMDAGLCCMSVVF